MNITDEKDKIDETDPEVVDNELNRHLVSIENGDYEKWLEEEAAEKKWDEAEEKLGSGETSDEGKDDPSSDDDILYNYPSSKSQTQSIESKKGKRQKTGKAKAGVTGNGSENMKMKHQDVTASYSEYLADEPYKDKPWKFSPGAEVEERKRTLANLDHQIKLQCMEQKEKKHALNKRWEKAYSKQQTLISLLRRFEQVKFDCYEKRKETHELFCKEKAETQEIGKRLEEGEKELHNLSHLLGKCQKRLEKNKIFKTFMREIQKEAHGEFKTLGSIADRAFSLQTARATLVDWIAQNHADIRTAAVELYQANKNVRRNMLRESSVLSELIGINDIISNQLAILEQQLDVTHMTTRQRLTVAGQIHLCINNLYMELSKQLGLETSDEGTGPIQQLKSIARFMRQLQNLYKDIRSNAAVGTDNVAIEVDTQALFKERLKYK